MSKWYEVHNYADGNEYVNQDSDISDIEKIWTTNIPWHFKPREVDDELPTPPYRFARRTDAVQIKDALQSARLDDWDRNRHVHTILGHRRPKWKVYTHVVDTAQ